MGEESRGGGVKGIRDGWGSRGGGGRGWVGSGGQGVVGFKGVVVGIKRVVGVRGWWGLHLDLHR